MNIQNNEEIEDFIILQAMCLLQKQYPLIIPESLSLVSTGYSYCPSKTVQITHTGEHRRILLSSVYSKIAIFDNLDLKPTDFLLNRIQQLFTDFLNFRKQRVVLYGLYSSWTIIETGVTQGSIFGLLLFLI